MAEQIKYVISVDNKEAIANVNNFSNQTIASGEKIGINWARIGKTMAIAGVAAGVAGATKAVKESLSAFSDFETEFANVSTLVDTNAVSMEKLKKQIMDLPSILGSATDNTKALYQAISAGVDPNVAVSFVGEAAKAAKAGLSDTLTAVDSGTTILNAFGMQASEITSVFDKMFVSVKAGKTTFNELSSSIGKVAPVASAAGVSVEEMLGAIASLTKQGIGTSQAVTSLKAAFSNIIKPSKQAWEAAEALGLEFSAAALQSKGFAGFLDSVREATGGNIEKMSVLFGSVEALNAMLALTSATGGKDFKQILDDMGNSAGETATAFDKQTKTYKTSMDSLKNSVEKIGITVGAKIAPELAKAAEAIAAWLESSEGMENSGLDIFVNAVKEVFAALQTILIALKPVWDLFLVGLEAATKIFSALMTIIKPILDLLGGLVTVISGPLTTGLNMLTGSLQGLSGIFSSIFGVIGSVTNALFGFGKSADDSFGRVKSGAASALSETQKLNREILATSNLSKDTSKTLKRLGDDVDAEKFADISDSFIKIREALKAKDFQDVTKEFKMLEQSGVDIGKLRKEVMKHAGGKKSFAALDEFEASLREIENAQNNILATSNTLVAETQKAFGTANVTAYTQGVEIVNQKMNEMLDLLDQVDNRTKLGRKIQSDKDYFMDRAMPMMNELREGLEEQGFDLSLELKPFVNIGELDTLLEILQEKKAELLISFKGEGSSVKPLTEKVQEMNGVLDEFTDNISNKNPDLTIAMHDTAGQSLTTALDTTERGFNKMFDGLIDGTLNVQDSFSGMVQDILANVSKMLASQAISGLMNMLGGSMGSMFGMSIPGFADGGAVRYNKPILVGERGPEIFMPRGPGNVVPNNQLGGGGGSFNVVNNITVEGGSSGNQENDRRMSNDIARAIDEKIKMQIAQQMRPGGLLNQTQRLGV